MAKGKENPIIVDTLYRDGFHGNSKGQYIASAVWYQAITGRNIFNNAFIPRNILPKELDVLKKAAYDAVVEYSWILEK